MHELHEAKSEFPIKVEGTHTLPYASQVVAVEGDQGLVLKLIRPLPHELAPGALFEMVFSAGEQRYQGLITFLQRRAYLTYAFSLPPALVPCDRRRHRRHPFRPREMVDVVAQDARVPGHGLTGPLLNLSLGGLAFRVDRIVKLDDGLRIPATAAFFERGRPLPLLRIRNLPKAPLVEARGCIAHADDAGGQVVLGIEFGDLTAENGALLQQVLELRERALRTTGPSPGAASPAPKSERRPRAAEEVPAQSAPEAEFPALDLLRRRGQDLVLVAAPGPESERFLERVREAGWFRAEAVADPALLAGRPPAAALVVLLDPRPGTLEQVRATQQALGPEAPPALFLASAPDPVAVLAEEPGWRILELPGEADAPVWAEALDRLTVPVSSDGPAPPG